MKTVTGRVISAEPISVAKAASILSRFASSEHGATQAVSAYLRRASAAFNELKCLHRDLKTSTLNKKKPRSDATLERNRTHESGEPGRSGEVKKKHKKKENESGKVGEFVENGGEIGGSESETVREGEPGHERVQVSQGPSQDGESERKEGKKKKKKKNREHDENVGDGEVTTKVKSEDNHRKEEKNKKKRKSDGEMGSEEKKNKKKKKASEARELFNKEEF
ncbi:PREDICTED: protein FAM133-like [Tarenaya hassleriana]|uniref:protein FAM133-like n=1 Tax=Tarenaya hassleriana TaxID=28532 RepID=UPI00053C2684|nr:PREDICTED: protein FAM133-like [Tarenaya hassleriana]XP_010535558.1 PREDICTED: protein FAM133-like [Tarenaya hassleriana]